MDKHIQLISEALDIIENQLDEDTLNLDSLAETLGYSRYHLHRLFTAVTGYSLHHYIQRRRLNEAAELLVRTDQSILDIALRAGYQSQRAFSKSFRALFQCSPAAFRRHKTLLPRQLKYDLSHCGSLRADRLIDVKKAEMERLVLTGCGGSTAHGFSIIGRCWRQLHRNKTKIPNRIDPDFLIGVHDYSQSDFEQEPPAFDILAAAQVSSLESIPAGMKTMTLPAGPVVIFYFRGKNEDSLEPVTRYIYGSWFPQSTCRFDETRLFDLVRYGEQTDDEGFSDIEFWVPIRP